MNLEQKPSQFNIEKFTSELETAIDNFLTAVDSVEGNKENGENVALSMNEDQKLQKIVDMSLEVLRSYDNKEKILTVLNTITDKVNEEKKHTGTFSNNVVLRDGFIQEKIILELLKEDK